MQHQTAAIPLDSTIATINPVANLTIEEKKLLVEKLLRQKLENSAQTAPMSKGQESLWFVHQNDVSTPAYNIANVFRVFSALDINVFQRALNNCIQRHASLRTRYGIVNDNNSQIIQASAPIEILTFDARSLSESELQAKISTDYQQPFNLAQLPILRAYLYQETEHKSIFMFVVHHIAFDAWSMWILMEELSEIYMSLMENRAIALPPQSAAYHNFAQQQVQLLKSEHGETLKNYWLDKLKGEIHPLTLNISKPRPRVQTFNGASHYFQLAPELAQGIATQAKKYGVTPYAMLLTVYFVLLHRHSGQDDICIASPTSGRNDPAFLRTVGYFVNPVILRSLLSNNPSFANLLQQVNHTVLDALEHQEYPFSSLIEVLNPKRDPSYTPLSQASFVFQKTHAEGLNAGWAPGQEGPKIQWAGLEIAQYPLDQQEGQFELELELIDSQKGFYGIFKYNTDLFTAANIQMLEKHFCMLATGILAAPELSLIHI